MQRLYVDDSRPGEIILERLPTVRWAPCELVAGAVAAASHIGAPIEYVHLMGVSGIAFTLVLRPPAFSHSDAVVGRIELLCQALQQIGFSRAILLSHSDEAQQALSAELSAQRPVLVLGCFPEAPWRCGLITGLLRDGLWAVLDLDGRLHRLAPRFDAVLLFGPPGDSSTPSFSQLISHSISVWQGQSDIAGPEAWQAWQEMLKNLHQPISAAPAHEFLYEWLLDARTCAAAWISNLAEQVDEIQSAWLQSAAGHLEALVELLEARRPPLHHPEVAHAFADQPWRQELAARIAQAAELDAQALHCLRMSLEADYPPEEVP